mgnify:CR=1 FL=1
MAFSRGVILLYLALVLVVTLDFAYSKLSCILIEKEALFDLKRGLIDKADRLSSWKGDNCCAWDGVGCDERTGHVIKLDLSNPVSFDSERYFDDKDYFANFSHNCLRGETIEVVERDVTEYAKQLTKLVKSVQHENVTLIHCQDVFKGLKYGKIHKMGHDQNESNGDGKDLKKRDIE